jgi:Domain of unknown function (DUF4780)
MDCTLVQQTPSTSMMQLKISSLCSTSDDDADTPISSPVQISTPVTKAAIPPTEEGSAAGTRWKMNGAMRKRYIYWKKQGLEPTEAYEKAKVIFKMPPKPRTISNPDTEDPHGPQAGGANQAPPNRIEISKRNRSDTKTSPQEPSKRWKADLHSKVQDRIQGPSYSAVVSSVKIGVIAESYPERKLTEEEFNQMKQGVEKLIAEQSKGSIKPKFAKLPSRKASGWILFHCANRATADWLKTLKLWRDRGCKALEEEFFPKEHVFTGYFLSSAEKPSEQVLRMIEGQNDDLNTENWKVLNRMEEKTCLALTFEVDQASYEQLSRQGFSVDFGFAQNVKLSQRKKEVGRQKDEGPTRQEDNPSSSAAAPQPSTSGQASKKAFEHPGGPKPPKSKKKKAKKPPSST